MLLDTILMALSAILRNKMRSLLTSLGIIIGVASVITMIHLGQSASQSVTGSIQELGANMLILQPARPRQDASGRRVSAPPFEIKDVEAIRVGVPDIYLAPTTSSNVLLAYGSATYQTGVTGSTNDFFDIRGWSLGAGRLFTPQDIQQGHAVCILGVSVVDALFVDRNPIGKTLRLRDTSCQVVGVLQAKGSSLGNDQDDVVVMPLKAVQKRLTGTDDIHTILLAAKSPEEVERVKQSLTRLMRTRRGTWEDGEDDFRVRDTKEIIDILSTVTLTLTGLLGAIAAISLFVGGIGIMNIMLVSVTERTREIGVRLAIGATSRDIQLQFLVEASVLSALGGVLGILAGVGLSLLLTTLLEFPFSLSKPAIFISFGFSACIGVVFGFFPARKAALLNPIEALRHE